MVSSQGLPATEFFCYKQSYKGDQLFFCWLRWQASSNGGDQGTIPPVFSGAVWYDQRARGFWSSKILT